MWIDVQGYRNMQVFPIDILEDNNVSMSAKGFYLSLYYLTNSKYANKICSLDDIAAFTNNSKDDLVIYYNELIDKGYIKQTKNKTTLLKKSNKKELTEEEKTQAQEMVNVEKPKPLNKYEKVTYIIDNEFELPLNVKAKLKEYYTAWLNGTGNFANQELHAYIVRSGIGSLVEMHLTEDEMIDSITHSLHTQSRYFYPPKKTKGTNSVETTTVVSNSYTPEELQQLKEKMNTGERF